MAKNDLYVLLVDDNPDDRILVIRELGREFPEFIVKQITGPDILDNTLKRGGFDLVITDFKLNWTDGIKVLQKVKKIDPDCPVIMFTGTGSEEIAVEAMKGGLDDYIIKGPKHFARLSVCVKSVLGHVDERKAMKEVETRYRNLFSRIPLGLYRVTPEGKFIDVNPHLINILGYPDRESLLSVNLSQLYIEIKDKKRWLELMKKEGVVRNFEMKLRRKDGSIIWVEDNSRVVYDNSGNILYYDGSMGDITERKNAEEELHDYRQHLEEMVQKRTSELIDSNGKLQQEVTEREKTEIMLEAEKERLAVTLRSIGDGVITTDRKGRVLLLNKAAEGLTGWTHEEAVGKQLGVVFNILSEKTRKKREDPVKRVLENEKIIGISENTILISKDSSEKNIEDSAAPIRDQDNNIIGVVIVFRDITVKKIMEEELQKTQKLESLGILAGGIAHDFNNILTAIIGYTSLLKIHKENDTRAMEKLAGIEKASYRAKYLTQQLLTFSRGGTPIKKVTSVFGLIKDAAQFALSGSNVKCNFSIQDDLWTAEVDEGQITQAIDNIVINAKEALPKGGIVEISAQNVVIRPEEVLGLEAGKYIKISVKDYGPGIPKGDLRKIFDPYFTTKRQGSGLGLTITYSIIKNHGGHIDVESKSRAGTTFHVYLPAAERESIKEEEEITEIGAGPGGRILLVDDEEDILKSTGQILDYLGYDVEFARDGLEAIEVYKKAKDKHKPIDVVIMDLTIPGKMGGKESIQKLKDFDPDVCAIVCSGYSTDPIMANYKHYGFSGVVTKPYRTKELKKVLNRLLKKPRKYPHF